MTTLQQRLKILAEVRYEFGLIILSIFGSALLGYLFNSQKNISWIIGIVGVIWVSALFGALLLRVEMRERASEMAMLERRRVSEVSSLESKANKEQRDMAINLMSRVISFSTRSLRNITEKLREYTQSQRKPGPSSESSNKEDSILLKNYMLLQVFRDIRSVFEGDTRGVNTTALPHNFFKIALYEPEPAPLNATVLRRTSFDYPEGIEPSPETETFDIAQHRRAAVVLTFSHQNIVVIEDIKTENTKPPEVKRWINRRENQAEDYESMVCAAIVSGTRGQRNRKCLGVLVIDTNRERYFQEERSFQAFLGDLLNPFRTILTSVLELENYFYLH